MNKREMMPIACDIAATILQRAIDNAEYIELSALDGFTLKDDDRLCECLQQIIDRLMERGARRPSTVISDMIAASGAYKVER